jgi:hypothetical protein
MDKKGDGKVVRRSGIRRRIGERRWSISDSDN